MDIEKVKRYSLIEIVLLAILMIGLFVANMIVKGRAFIQLSDPIALFGSGLSVSMPDNTNPGWAHTPVWQYEQSESCMTLVGQFQDPGRGRIEVRWRYILSTPNGSEQELLKQRALETGAVIQAVDITGSTFPITYARMLSVPASGTEEYYWGVMRLDYNRSLELIVMSLGINGFYEETIFKSLASSIQYQKPQRLTDGHALMDEYLKTQTQTVPKDQLSDEVFLIKEPVKNANWGYYIIHHSLYTDQEQTLRRLQIRQFEDKYLTLNSSLWFNPPKREYRWQTEVSYFGTRGPYIYDIETDESGSLKVKCNVKETETFPSGQFFLPEPLLPELAFRFLESESKEVIVDVLGGLGQLVPVYLEKISPDQAKFKSEAIVSVIRMNFLHTQNSYEELYFDKSRNLLRKFEQQPNRRASLWVPASIEDLQRIFQMDFQVPGSTTAYNTYLDSEKGMVTFHEG